MSDDLGDLRKKGLVILDNILNFRGDLGFLRILELEMYLLLFRLIKRFRVSGLVIVLVLLCLIRLVCGFID